MVSLQDGAELLRQANAKYVAKDLMGAMKLYEDVLAQVSVPSCDRPGAHCVYCNNDLLVHNCSSNTGTDHTVTGQVNAYFVLAGCVPWRHQAVLRLHSLCLH